MIISQMNGGLGNQLFQYALGRNLALKNNTELKLDIADFNREGINTLRKYELHHFNINATIASKRECKNFEIKMDPFSRAYRLAFILARHLPPEPKNVIWEKNTAFDHSVLDVKDEIYLKGFWQSYKYFQDIEEIIRREFTIKSPLSGQNKIISQKIISSKISISVHVRRGDYVSNKTTNAFHGTCSLDYYQEAINHLTKSLKDPHFFIFSDDPEWTQANLKFSYPTTYVTHNTPENGFEDLRLMSLCKHFIIANSSFSWWGAWLSSNPDKQVIAPKKWFAGSDKDTSDLTPPNWLRI